MMNKGIWREQYYTIAACRQGKVEQVYRYILKACVDTLCFLDTVDCWTQ
jgi:hypothetical protein